MEYQTRMNNQKSILILTADAGFGHRSAANAIAAALQDQYGDQCSLAVLNPLDDDRTPRFLRDSQSDYDSIVHQAPELYKLGYDASDATLSSAIVESALTVLLYEVMRDLIKTYNPNAIITTYPLYQTPLFAISDINKKEIPVLTVITDLVTVHKLWFNPNVSACLVPTPQVQDLALSNGIPQDRIKITGIPVHPNIYRETHSKEAIRADLGWDPALPTLLAVGSKRVENLVEMLDGINHYGGPLQLAVVAGKDDDLYHKLQEVRWHIPIHLYNYVDNMPALMHASDALMSKAGGLIVTEALACGLPMMLINVIPGQETGNAQFVIENDAGQQAETPLEALEVLAHWMMRDQSILKRQAANARSIGKPHSAYDVAELVWTAANTEPAERPDPESIRRTRLIEMLNGHKVRWQDNLASFQENRLTRSENLFTPKNRRS
jgi:1,2-diacylglycerol 3-beta-galactosyltransferase